MINIHGTLISINNKGVLLLGPSGSGKSDLALRFICENKALLVADDRVILEREQTNLFGTAPDTLKGLLEVRGIGIKQFPIKDTVKINLCVELCMSRNDIERYPEDDYIDFLGISVKKIRLYPFDCSTIYKIIIKLDEIVN